MESSRHGGGFQTAGQYGIMFINPSKSNNSSRVLAAWLHIHVHHHHVIIIIQHFNGNSMVSMCKWHPNNSMVLASSQQQRSSSWTHSTISIKQAASNHNKPNTTSGNSGQGKVAAAAWWNFKQVHHHENKFQHKHTAALMAFQALIMDKQYQVDSMALATSSSCSWTTINKQHQNHGKFWAAHKFGQG